MLSVEVFMRFHAKTFLSVLELIDFVNNVLGAVPAKYTILRSTAEGTVDFVWEAP